MSDLRVLQRVVFPDRSDLDVVPLYVETDLDRGAGRREDDKEKTDETRRQRRGGRDPDRDPVRPVERPG